MDFNDEIDVCIKNLNELAKKADKIFNKLKENKPGVKTDSYTIDLITATSLSDLANEYIKTLQSFKE